MSTPRVSVVLPVRDGAAHVAAAVESILGQTLADLELLVVDDGSTDATPAVLAGVRDARCRVLTVAAAGTAAALNHGIAHARGPLIARMDADDVALPERLARQLAFLERHADVGVLGTGWREQGPGGDVVEVAPPPADDAAIRRVLPRRNPMAHPTVVMRRAAGDAVGWYDARLPVVQDYDLWLRLASRTRFANLPEPLLIRTFSTAMTSLARDDLRLATEVRVKWAALRRGDLPATAAVHLLRPVLVRLLPHAVRRARRRRRAGGLGLTARHRA
jgi:glycosyltransferase involved in cell wall biosynthesis